MSGVYIGVDGKARKVKGGYIGVDGKARKIKKGYIGVDGVAQLCWTAFEADPVFANNSWENIALACQLNAVPDSWAVGDQKTMTINGTDYAIDIIGKEHDNYADGNGKAPLTFQLHDCYMESRMNQGSDNAGGWLSCEMRTVTLPTILTAMPIGVQTAIKEVNKLSSEGSYSSVIQTSADKLFLLSEIEVYGAIKWSKPGEGYQYDYYANGSSKIKKINGKDNYWWMRSPYGEAKTGFCLSINDTVNSQSNAYSSFGVSFAFCF